MSSLYLQSKDSMVKHVQSNESSFSIRVAIFNFLNKLHLVIFGHAMSDLMKDFLYYLSWSFLGVLFSAVILFIINILAGRILGPDGYGKYNLILAIGASATIFISLGFDTTAVKFIAQSNNNEEKNRFLSNSLIAIFPTSIVVFTLLFLLRREIAVFLHTDIQLVFLALVFTLLFTYKSTLDGFIKALNKFKFQAFVKVAEAMLVLMLFVILFLVQHKSGYQYYLLAVSIGAAFAIGVYFMTIRDRLSPWSNAAFDKEIGYLKIFFLFAINGVVLNSIDKFFIVRYMSSKDLGVYSAYLVSSVTVASQLILLLNNVFFPMVNQVGDKKQIVRKLDQLAVFSFLPIIITVSFISYVVMRLFGSKYEINWVYILLVSVVAFLQIITSFYISTIGSSERLFAFSLKLYYLKLLFIVGLYFLIYQLHRVGIASVLIILVLSSVYDILNTKITIKQVVTPTVE